MSDWNMFEKIFDGVFSDFDKLFDKAVKEMEEKAKSTETNKIDYNAVINAKQGDGAKKEKRMKLRIELWSAKGTFTRGESRPLLVDTIELSEDEVTAYAGQIVSNGEAAAKIWLDKLAKEKMSVNLRHSWSLEVSN